MVRFGGREINLRYVPSEVSTLVHLGDLCLQIAGATAVRMILRPFLAAMVSAIKCAPRDAIHGEERIATRSSRRQRLRPTAGVNFCPSVPQYVVKTRPSRVAWFRIPESLLCWLCSIAIYTHRAAGGLVGWVARPQQRFLFCSRSSAIIATFLHP